MYVVCLGACTAVNKQSPEWHDFSIQSLCSQLSLTVQTTFTAIQLKDKNIPAKIKLITSCICDPIGSFVVCYKCVLLNSFTDLIWERKGGWRCLGNSFQDRKWCSEFPLHFSRPSLGGGRLWRGRMRGEWRTTDVGERSSLSHPAALGFSLLVAGARLGMVIFVTWRGRRCGFIVTASFAIWV